MASPNESARPRPGKSARNRRKARAKPRSSFALEQLEDRVVPVTITVHSLADDGPETLRRAIIAANTNPGPDTIEFDIDNASPGVNTIALLSALPAITDPVTIDGYNHNPVPFPVSLSA